MAQDSQLSAFVVVASVIPVVFKLFRPLIAVSNPFCDQGFAKG